MTLLRVGGSLLGRDRLFKAHWDRPESSTMDQERDWDKGLAVEGDGHDRRGEGWVEESKEVMVGRVHGGA